MDLYLGLLSGPEQKVMDYILRRTYGWQKLEDKISLSQFKRGIVNQKTGKITDRGTGIKNDETILSALNNLEKMGFIAIIRKRGKTNIYKLQLLLHSESTTHQNREVATTSNADTTKNVTKDISQNSSFKKNQKPYYQGHPMRYVEDFKKWYVIKDGEWLIFAGKKSDIEWRDKKSPKTFL
jgi:hypothetical protein